MSAIHEQAMNYVYQQVLQRLIGYLSRTERTALQLLIQRIIVAAGGIDQMGEYKVLVTHGGGKGSSYTLALLRAAQLTIAGRAPKTFQLRVATLRHAGMTQAALDTIHRGYSALFVHDDPRVELLMVENQEVLAFNHLRPASNTEREASRRNMLMIGHLTSGDIRSTLCNTPYLALGDFYQRVTSFDGGVHALVCCDSSRKQRQYLAWLRKNAKAAGVKMSARLPLSLNGLFAHMDEWSLGYYREVYGEQHVPQEEADKEVHRNLTYIGIADLIDGLAQGHAPILKEFLAYTRDEFGFHFNHPAYVNPLLMAHLCGLRAESGGVHDYGAGVERFMRYAEALMGRSKVPASLVAHAASEDIRILSITYAHEFFALEESHLTCLLSSPFIRRGQRLESFLRCCHPGMLVTLPELHNALEGKPAPDMLVQWLTDISGLPLSLLQHLYQKNSITQGRGFLAGDRQCGAGVPSPERRAYRLSGC